MCAFMFTKTLEPPQPRFDHRFHRQGRQSGARENEAHYATSASGSGVHAPSDSSGAGLVKRLGSALQSWTSGRSADPSRPWGGGGEAAREGRPGPIGAKYTQQAPESYSPFEPSPGHQLRTRLPIEPAFIAAAAVRRRGASGEPAGADVAEAPPTTTTADIPPPLGVGEPTDTQPELTGTVGAADAGERIGRSRSTSKTTGDWKLGDPAGAAEEEDLPTPAPIETSSSGGVPDVSCEGGTASLRSADSGVSAPPSAAGSVGVPLRGISGGREDGESTEKKMGIWELKAEKSRVEQALAQAESDRDVERARARVAADRLAAALARLERIRCGGGDGGGGDGGGSGVNDNGRTVGIVA